MQILRLSEMRLITRKYGTRVITQEGANTKQQILRGGGGGAIPIKHNYREGQFLWGGGGGGGG